MSAVAAGVLGALVGALGGGAAGFGLGTAQQRIAFVDSLRSGMITAGVTEINHVPIMSMSRTAFLGAAITALTSALSQVTDSVAKAALTAIIAFLTKLQSEVPP